MKKILVLGGGGFIGSHLVKRFKREGHWVRVVDLKYPEFSKSPADDFIIGDLRLQQICDKAFDIQFDEVYQLAADMGGAGYIFTGEHDADIMHNSALINLNVVERCHKTKVGKVFYSSSACMYPAYNQEDPDNPKCSEESAYPAAPDSEYGWEKLFSERLYLAYARNHGMRVRIARYHNIFGPEGTWQGGKEKAPAALCRKIAQSTNGIVEVWGPGDQTRSFLYIDECIQGIHKIQDGDYEHPLNLGSERSISINALVKLIADIAGKSITVKNLPGPIGVQGRNSHNNLISKVLGWQPADQLEHGLTQLYAWIVQQVNKELNRS